MKKEYHQGNRNLIAAIYEKYSDDVKRYFASYTHDTMRAEDMLHDLFIKMMQLDIITETTAHNLLFVMAKHTIIDDARRQSFMRKQQENLRYSMNSMEVSACVKAETSEILALEQQKLSQMATKRARVYKMYRHEELSASEIAQRLDLSIRTVEAHIYIATKEMRTYLKRII